MKKLKLLLGLALGLCVTFIQANFAFASTEDMIEKQSEVDKYIFEEHLEELEEMGIHVTHTSPEEDHVEIGISPYTEEHAAYLTEIFGEDVVKVVEGEQAVTFGTTNTEVAAGEQLAEPTSESGTNSTWFMLLGVIVVAGAGVAVMIRKKQTA